MPLPKPTKDESKQDFTSRFMADETALADFPEKEQRSAVAHERFTATNSAEPDPTEPQRRKITINSKTSGRYKMRTVGGAKHMVTEMVPIVGDTVMNSLFYPDDEVSKSYGQFTNLPAPAGHPIVEGKKVSAYHPMAINAFNVGGFTRNPRRDGKKVVTEFWLNTDVADRTDDGKELMRRIKEGEPVGVSTGLDATFTAENGKGEDGVKYRIRLSNFEFDHVAVLLDEEAAGSHVGTELITNDEGEEISTGEVPATNVTLYEWQEELREALVEKFGSQGKRVWMRDFILDDSSAVYEVYDEATSTETLFKVKVSQDANGFTIADNPTEVTEKREFVPVTNEEEEDMELTIENTTEFLVNIGKQVVDPSEVITPEQVVELSTYAENKEGFDAYMAEKSTVLNAKREECKAAASLTDADVANLGIDAMDKIIEGCKTNVNNAARAGGAFAKADPESDGATTASNFMSGTPAAKE